MPGQDQPAQEAPAVPAALPPAVGAGERTQLNQMRKNLATEIRELRRQVLLVQLQSMKVMQQSIHSVFKTQADKTSEQIALQGTELQQQLEEETEALKSTVVSAPAAGSEPAGGDGQAQAFNDIVLKAMQAAQQSVDGAMQAAQKIMSEAESILKSA